MDYLLEFKNEFEKCQKSRNIYLFSRGRVALYVILNNLHLQQGDEVLMPGYTCVMVPAAVKAVGLTPKYCDIKPETYNINPNTVLQSITPKTKVLIIQHTYGIPCEITPLLETAKKYKLYVIEDCCHAFGSTYNQQLCGSFGDAAFYSGQWNKPFTTGLGGILTIKDNELAKEIMRYTENEMQQPSWLRNQFLSWQIQLYDLLVNPRSVMLITKIYRLLASLGLVIGSSSREEFLGKIPANYFQSMAPAQAKKGCKEIIKISDRMEHRKILTRFYTGRLKEAGFITHKDPEYVESILLRYPVRVENKNSVLKQAFRRSIEIGSWFESPMHPLETHWDAFNYHPGLCPVAETASDQVINLPLHNKISLNEAQRIIKFLTECAIPVREAGSIHQ